MAPFARSYRVNDEALLAETAVWPIFFFIMDIFFALKGSRLFILVAIATYIFHRLIMGNVEFDIFVFVSMGIFGILFTEIFIE